MGVLLPLLDQVRLGAQALADHGLVEATRVRWALAGPESTPQADPAEGPGAEAGRSYALAAAGGGPPDPAGLLALSARALPAALPEAACAKAGEALDWATWELEYARRPAPLVIGTAVGELLLAGALPVKPARLARLLATWMLARAGYRWLAMVPLEAVLEEAGPGLAVAYARLARRESAAGLESWLEAGLALLAASARAAGRCLQDRSGRPPLPRLQEDLLALAEREGRLTSGRAQATLGLSRNTLKDNLRRLVDMGFLARFGARRGAFYTLPRAGGAFERAGAPVRLPGAGEPPAGGRPGAPRISGTGSEGGSG